MRKFNESLVRNTALDKPDLPPLGYYWVPAAVDGSLSSMKVGFKHVASPDFLGMKQKVLDNRSYLFIGTPTRKLVITSGTLKPFKGQLDGTREVGLDLLRSTSFSLYGVSDAPRTVLSDKRERIRKVSYVIQDSGGFQLATGVEKFIDPTLVARAHSLYADSGVALDIPASNLMDVPLVLASARMLVANNKILREQTDPAVRLLNVCHGYNLATRLEYLKIIMAGEKLDSLCVGGLRQTAIGGKQAIAAERSTPIGFICHVLLSMLYTEKTYYHYHILGVATDWQMALLSLVSHVHQKLVTSDSATHALAGKSGSLLFYGTHAKTSYKMGRDMEDFVNVRCGCPMCSVMGYEFPFRDGKGSMPEIHNGYMLGGKARMFDAIVKTRAPKLKASHLGELLMANTCLKSTATPHFIREFFQAVDLVMNTKNYKDLARFQHAKKGHNSLFAVKDEEAPTAESFIAVLKRYEDYHGKSFRK